MGDFLFRCNNMTKEQKFPSISPSVEPHLVQCWQCLSVLRLLRGHNWQSLLCCQFAKWFHIHQAGLVNGCLLGILKNGCEVSVRSLCQSLWGIYVRSVWSLCESVQDLCVLSVDEVCLWGFYVRSLWGYMRSLKGLLSGLWKISEICARFLSEDLWGNMSSLCDVSVWSLCGAMW